MTEIKVPVGSTKIVASVVQGMNGKTAYQSAVSGGYTGTEAQFNAILASIPTNASQLPFTPTSNLSSTNVQNALAELDSEKSGKLFATNLVTNGDFSNGTNGWSVTTPVTVANNEASFTQTATNQGINQAINIPSGHKFYITCKVFGSSTLLALEIQKRTTPWTSFATKAHSAIAQYENLTLILTGTSETNDVNIRIRDTASSGWALTKVKEVIAINLTALFGSGNEPTKEQMDWIFTERDRLGLGHLNGTQELLPMVSLLNLINKKANIAQEAWITPTLLNGATAGTVVPQYYKDTLGNVHFKGNLVIASPMLPFISLPVGYRPSNVVGAIAFPGWEFTTNKFSRIRTGDSNTLVAEVTAGRIISLDNIKYRAEG